MDSDTSQIVDAVKKKTGHEGKDGGRVEGHQLKKLDVNQVSNCVRSSMYYDESNLSHERWDMHA